MGNYTTGCLHGQTCQGSQLDACRLGNVLQDFAGGADEECLRARVIERQGRDGGAVLRDHLLVDELAAGIIDIQGRSVPIVVLDQDGQVWRFALYQSYRGAERVP